MRKVRRGSTAARWQRAGDPPNVVRNREAVANVALATAEHWRIDGHDQRSTPAALGFLHDVAGDAPIPIDVELEPERRAEGAHVLERAGGGGAHHHDRAGSSS